MKIIMAKSRIAVLIVVLIFSATTVFLVVNRNATTKPYQDNTKTLQLEIPDSPWEPAFFETLEERTKAVGLPGLRTIVLPENDFEVRFWYEGSEIINGIVIRRAGQEWSASWIYQVQDSRPSSAQLVTLDPPKSGWEVFWNNIVNAGILTLPDSPRPQCPTEALDGISYIVETNVNRKYRTYMYSNPQWMKCSEAKQMLRLEETIRQEFSLQNWLRWALTMANFPSPSSCPANLAPPRILVLPGLEARSPALLATLQTRISVPFDYSWEVVSQ